MSFDKDYQPFKVPCANPGCKKGKGSKRKMIYVFGPRESGYCCKACRLDHDYSKKFLDEDLG